MGDAQPSSWGRAQLPCPHELFIASAVSPLRSCGPCVADPCLSLSCLWDAALVRRPPDWQSHPHPKPPGQRVLCLLRPSVPLAGLRIYRSLSTSHQRQTGGDRRGQVTGRRPPPSPDTPPPAEGPLACWLHFKDKEAAVPLARKHLGILISSWGEQSAELMCVSTQPQNEAASFQGAGHGQAQHCRPLALQCVQPALQTETPAVGGGFLEHSQRGPRLRLEL